MKVVTAEIMRRLDERAIREIGVPGVVLMENAGRGTARAIAEKFPEALRGRVVVLAGRGNNGGDGFVVARVLRDQGAAVEVFLLAQLDDVTGDARVFLNAARACGVPVREFPDRDRLPDEFRLDDADLIVDALLGTGLSKEATGAVAEAIARVNASDAWVVAVDLPSGLSADTGRPLGDAVRADLTVTFGLMKLAHVTYPGLDCCGEVVLVDIGIPARVVDEAGIPFTLVEDADVTLPLVRARDARAHKGTFGHLLVLAGSRGFTGAGVLATRAAARMGAGLVTLGCPRGIATSVESRLLDAMTLPLPETDAGVFAESAAASALGALESRTALAIGPGMTIDHAAARFVRAVLAKSAVPAVVDADALNALAGHLGTLRDRKAPTILTPHPGEAARLLGCSSADVQDDRIGGATRLAIDTGAIVVLKGARTVTATPDDRVFINPTGNPGLASGGTGDVLTGMIGGLLAQREDPLWCALAGVYLHGLAADRAAIRTGERALVAGDVLDELPRLLAAIESGCEEGESL
jgi:NAD(P)H-hydrate epimerase